VNYKYEERPKTKILWSNRDQWSVKDLEDRLPQEEETPASQYMTSDAAKLYRRWERKIPHRVRRELMQKNEPSAGRRSEVFMRLAFDLMEAGVPKADACVILKASVWNKYAGRRDEDKQIDAAWDKATNKKLNASRAVVGEKDDEPLIRADQLKWKETHWLWYPRIPANGITILGARGGTGKGLVCCDIVGRITTGEYWPCSRERIEAGNVLWGEAEDKIQETLLPRLIAAKADQSKVYFCSPSQFRDYDIREFIRENNIKLIVLSPLISFLEGLADSNAAVDTRRAMEDLDALIDGTGCAIIGVMHIKKGEASTSVDRLLGSSEFGNYARSVMMLYREEDDLVRMIHPKYNLGPQAEDLILKPTNRREKRYPRGQFIGVDWDRPDDRVDVDSVFEKKEKSTRRAETTTAGEWLQQYMRGKGELRCEEIFADAEKNSHSVSAVKRAKMRLGKAIIHRRTAPGKVVWSMTTARP
jgi:RecA-family ATPase